MAWFKEAWQRGIPASAVMAMTPAQLYCTFFHAPAKTQPDKLEVLIRDNDERGKRGLKPLCPQWLRELLRERTK